MILNNKLCWRWKNGQRQSLCWL